MGHYGLTFWLPVLIQTAGVEGTVKIGFVTAVPYVVSVVVAILVGWNADERRAALAHRALMIVGASRLDAQRLGRPATMMAVACLTLRSLPACSAPDRCFGGQPRFGGAAAAAGIAAVNSIGNLAGFVSPYAVGWLKDLTRSTEAGMYAVSAAPVVGALAVLGIPQRLVNR
jgi:nitrate/nitrite transporter NarK